MKVQAYRLMMVRDGQVQPPENPVNNPQAAADILREYLKDADREHFAVLALNVRGRFVGLNTVAVGTLDSATVHPREVFKFAIMANASSIIVGHNHPSGDVNPSPDDITISKRLKECGAMLGIELLDSIIVGEGAYYSLKHHDQL